MAVKLGLRMHSVKFTDSDLIRACKEWVKVVGNLNTDNPSEADLVRLRDRLAMCFVGGVAATDMISLHWLRNEYVRLRKAGKLKAA